MTVSATPPSLLIDLSHSVRNGLVTYPGLPAPEISTYLSREASRERYAPGTEFHIGRIEMVANTGTYLDAPFHRYPDKSDLSQLPLESLADLPGCLVDATRDDTHRVDASLFQDVAVQGKAVLVRTGWSTRWGRPGYFEGHPYLTEGAAYLADEGAALVGIDSLNIDGTADGRRPAHSILLGRGIPIVEHLTGLGQIPARPFRFFAVPVKVEGMGSFPVRAFALVEPA